MMRVILFLVVFMGCIFTAKSFAQRDSAYSDGFSGKVGVGVLSSSRPFRPFYLVMNRSGEVTDDQGVFQFADFEYNKLITNKLRLATGLRFRNKVISKQYLDLSYQKISLKIGRYQNPLGGIEGNDLTSGSLAMGNNAQPIPQIEIALNDYLDLPYTYGYVKVKGGMSHGWFEEDRFVSRALLHQKHAKVLIDLEPLIGLRVYSSIIHFAQYGGTSRQGVKQPSSFDDFKKVFFGQGIPNPQGGTAGESNAVGNHVGITEWTLDKKLGESRLKLHYQKPFEDQGSMQYISFKDFLVGLEWTLSGNGLLKKAYFEFVRSMSQSGPGLPDPNRNIVSRKDNYGYEFGGRDDYYNNYLYRSGWTYQGRILSNPLFLTYQWSLNFLPQFPNYNVEVVNNRLRAFHFGVLLEPINKIKVRSMVTFTKNSGTYAGLYEGRFSWNGIKTNPEFEYVFLNGKNQFYSLVELNYMANVLNQPANLKAMFAFDSGELYSNTGMELSIQFML